MPRCTRRRRRFDADNSALFAELAAKERELNKARELVKLHEAVPTMARARPAIGSPRRPSRSSGRRRIRSTCSRCRVPSPTRRTTRCSRRRTWSRSSRERCSGASARGTSFAAAGHVLADRRRCLRRSGFGTRCHRRPGRQRHRRARGPGRRPRRPVTNSLELEADELATGGFIGNFAALLDQLFEVAAPSRGR